MEDSFSHIYGSVGKATPAADTLLSEPAIVAGIAMLSFGLWTLRGDSLDDDPELFIPAVIGLSA